MNAHTMTMFLQGIAVFLAILGAMAGMASGGVLLAYLLMDICLILYTAILVVIATVNFNRMEKT